MFPGLKDLQQVYGDRVIVLAFPSNVFYLQEPGAPNEVMNGYKHVRPGGDFVPNFPVFGKMDVNGINEDPMYTWIKQLCPATSDTFYDRNFYHYDPIRNNDIRWNWEKILFDYNGHPFMRYGPDVDPRDMYNDINGIIVRANPALNGTLPTR